MFLFPTRNRPDKLAEVLEVHRARGFAGKILIIIDSDDFSYRGMEFPPFCQVEVVPPSQGASSYYNYIFYKYPNESYYGLLTDDLYPMVDGWDKNIEQYLRYFPAITINDNVLAPFTDSFYLLRNDFVRITSLNPTHTNHFFQDAALQLLAVGNNLCLYAPDLAFDHRQLKLQGKTDETATRARNPELYAAAQRNFFEWTHSRQFDGLNEQLRAHYKIEVPEGIPKYNAQYYKKYRIGILGTKFHCTQKYDITQNQHYAKVLADGVRISRDDYYRDPLPK